MSTTPATTLSGGTVAAMLVYLGVEPEEGADQSELLNDTLAEYNLTRDQFVTEPNCFALGYHRGLQGLAFTEEQAPQGDDGADGDSMIAIEDGYAFGLEARDLRLTPPPSLVYEAFKAGDLEMGCLAQWGGELDLSGGHRLAQSITVGSGKDAIVIPAGTPVDLLSEDVDKDGISHAVVLFDGSPLIVPNPEDAPRVVSADVHVAPEKKARKRKSGGGKAKGERKERGPTLKDSIIHVLEAQDGGNGALQTNGVFAARVLKRCRELGIGDKCSSFVQKADRHVPYYINCYKPHAKTGEPGRLGVKEPLAGVVAAIEARKYYLRANGTHEERLTAIPEEIRTRMEDTKTRLETSEPAPKAAKDADKSGEDKTPGKGKGADKG